MKKMVFVCIFILVAAYASVAIASPPVGAKKAIIREIQSLNQDPEQAVEMWDFKDKSELPADVGQPYQVYIFHRPTIKGLATNYKAGSFKKALINNTAIGSPFWEYPVVDQAGKARLTASVRESNGNVAVDQIGPTISSEMLELIANEIKLYEKLKQQNITGITSITHVRDTSPEIDYLYLTTKESDYIMPLEDIGGEPVRQMGFEVGKAFPAKDFVLKIAEQVKAPATDKPPTVPQKFGPDGPKDPRLMLAGGNYPPSSNQIPTTSKSYTTYYGFAAGTAMILSTVIWMFMRRKKKVNPTT
jgi:hypothetical protein